MKKLIKNPKGFTLVEVIVSLMLSLILFTSSAGLVGTLASFRDKSLIHHELYESANFIQQMFEREFRKSSAIIGIKGENSSLISQIPTEYIGFNAIMLKRSHYVISDKLHKSIIIYKKGHSTKPRKPLFMYKGSSLDLNICKNTESLVGYESGTNLKTMELKSLDNGIYEIRMVLTFEDLGEKYERNFRVKLQKG